jgi:hypothetical protein
MEGIMSRLSRPHFSQRGRVLFFIYLLICSYVIIGFLASYLSILKAGILCDHN